MSSLTHLVYCTTDVSCNDVLADASGYKYNVTHDGYSTCVVTSFGTSIKVHFGFGSRGH